MIPISDINNVYNEGNNNIIIKGISGSTITINVENQVEIKEFFELHKNQINRIFEILELNKTMILVEFQEHLLDFKAEFISKLDIELHKQEIERQKHDLERQKQEVERQRQNIERQKQEDFRKNIIEEKDQKAKNKRKLVLVFLFVIIFIAICFLFSISYYNSESYAYKKAIEYDSLKIYENYLKIYCNEKTKSVHCDTIKYKLLEKAYLIVKNNAQFIDFWYYTSLIEPDTFLDSNIFYQNALSDTMFLLYGDWKQSQPEIEWKISNIPKANYYNFLKKNDTETTWHFTKKELIVNGYYKVESGAIPFTIKTINQDSLIVYNKSETLKFKRV